MRVIAILTALLLAVTSCSEPQRHDDVFAAATARIGESLAILGWNMSVSNLRFDAENVLIDVDAAPAAEGEPHAAPRTSASVSTVGWRPRSRRTRSAAAGT